MSWAKLLPIIFKIIEFLLTKAQASEGTMKSLKKLRKSCEEDELMVCKEEK